MKKRFMAVLLTIPLCFTVLAACTEESAVVSSQTESSVAAESASGESSAENSKEPEFTPVPETMKILCIGNSFSADTIEHTADILKALGVKNVKVVNLYIGGCSIKKHFYNAQNDIAAYEYYSNTGNGWKGGSKQKISGIIKTEDWDWISIQHGTADGSRYAEEDSYKDLKALVDYVRGIAGEDTKIAFNMTWVGEANSHEEMVAYGNDQLKYFGDICTLTKNLVLPTEGIDIVSPTGTAIQNARTVAMGSLNRDGYHLTNGLGRYIAGLTFIRTLTGMDINNIDWAPQGVGRADKEMAIKAANAAFENPFELTNLS